jgi:hypothetical protein
MYFISIYENRKINLVEIVPIMEGRLKYMQKNR